MRPSLHARFSSLSGKRRRFSAAGFTLVEMLVAIAVVALMMGMLSQMLDTTERATQLTHREMNASDCTRQVLDSLETDLENLVPANGLALLISQDANNNTLLAFPTESRGPSGQTDSTRFMAVAYQLTGNNLTRSVAPVSWSTAQLAGATAQAATSSTSSVITSTGLRFETVILLDNGNTVPLSQSVLGAAQTWKTSIVNGETLPAGYYNLVLSTSPVDPANPKVTGIIVGVAALDSQTIKIGNASAMGTGLPSPSATAPTAIDAWEAERTNGQFMSTYPRPAVNALSLGQQIYTLK